MKRFFNYNIFLSIAILCMAPISKLLSQNSWLSAPSIYEVQSPKHETRAVWLATIGGIDWPRKKVQFGKTAVAQGIQAQQRELIDILDRLQRANINTVLLQTRVRGSVIYPSDIEPWDDCLTGRFNQNPGYDPLAFAIEECHKRGMELHAWIVTIPLGTATKQRRLGSKSITQTHPQLCKTIRGEVFMKPSEPGTAEYVASLCQEIAKRYDVDGISLDYIRYPEKEYRFDDSGEYKKFKGSLRGVQGEFKGSSRDDSRGVQGSSSVQEFKCESLADWRRDNITRIVRAVHDSIKPLKPWIKLSSSPLGRYRDLSQYSARGWCCYDAVYQDPRLWLREDLQDMLFPMMYYQGDLFYPFLLDWKENSYDHPVAPGLGIYFLDKREGNWQMKRDVRPQMYTARNTSIGGVCFYRSYYLTSNYQHIYDETSAFFATPSLPAVSTQFAALGTSPTPPTDLVRTENTISWHSPSLTSNLSSLTYNIYASYTYPVDIEDPNNIVALRVPNLSVSNLSTLNPNVSVKYIAVTAMDRFGNESIPLQEPVIYKESVSPRVEIIQQALKRHFSQGTITKKSKKRKR